MKDVRVSAIRSLQLGVPDLKQSVDFYQRVWGLQEISRDAGIVYLRATGTGHHALAIQERPRAELLSLSFEAVDQPTVDGLYARAVGLGTQILAKPAGLDAAAGGGYGFSVLNPDGQTVAISTGLDAHPEVIGDLTRPKKLSHVVLNSSQVAASRGFFFDLLGFRLSDSTAAMDFIRCSTDHHAIALAHSKGPGINHIAYEMEDIDSLMRGAGRLKKNGFDMEWGLGRHGPGDNVFSYFIEPNGFASEYTTGMQQIDLEDEEYQPNDAEYWKEFDPRPCRWGVAMSPSAAMIRAMNGQIVEERNASCDAIISRKLAS